MAPILGLNKINSFVGDTDYMYVFTLDVYIFVEYSKQQQKLMGKGKVISH